VPSLSVIVARSAVTWLSEPVIVRLVVPAPETPVPAADRSPCLSESVTVTVSPEALPVSERLRPPIAPAWLTPTVAVAGAVIPAAR
jgi:hypothetical protein